MKEFVFNEYGKCINPNRIPVGNKEFYAEIVTACKDGKWYHGFWYWTRGHSFDMDAYLNTASCDTEREAIMKESEYLASSLSDDVERSRCEVPLSVFNELRDIYNKYRNPQMSLF